MITKIGEELNDPHSTGWVTINEWTNTAPPRDIQKDMLRGAAIGSTFGAPVWALSKCIPNHKVQQLGLLALLGSLPVGAVAALMQGKDGNKVQRSVNKYVKINLDDDEIAAYKKYTRDRL